MYAARERALRSRTRTLASRCVYECKRIMRVRELDLGDFSGPTSRGAYALVGFVVAVAFAFTSGAGAGFAGLELRRADGAVGARGTLTVQALLGGGAGRAQGATRLTAAAIGDAIGIGRGRGVGVGAERAAQGEGTRESRAARGARSDGRAALAGRGVGRREHAPGVGVARLTARAQVTLARCAGFGRRIG